MTANFDPVAGIYHGIERLAHGRHLEEARLRFIDRLSHARRILILGEGDGRFLKETLTRFPSLSVDCIEASAAMIARANGRLTPAERQRVRFRRKDAAAAPIDPNSFDAVVTLFFLDCFTEDALRALVPRLAAGLTAGGLWLWADFAVPERGWARVRAKAWVGFLYRFFGWTTGLAVRSLPPAEEVLLGAGLERVAEATLDGGLLRTAVFRTRNAP